MTPADLMTRFTLSALLASISSPALAHHGVNSEFDVTRDLEIQGTISRARLVNPHAYLYVDVRDDSGESVTWTCEMGSWTSLKRSDWSRDKLKAGTQVTIEGHPAREEANTCYIESLRLADDTLLERKPGPEEQEAHAVTQHVAVREDGMPNLAGNWAAARHQPLAPGIGAPPGIQRRPPGAKPIEGLPVEDTPAPAAGRPPEGKNGRQPAPNLADNTSLTDAAKAAAKGYDRDDNPRFNCMATNIFEDWTFDRMVNHIEQTTTTLHIDYGFMDLERTIHLNEDSHPDTLEASRAGHSIGHWEGDVLVVDTVGFTPGYLLASPVDGVAIMSSDQLHTVERFSLSDDGQTLHRQYTIEDPTYLTTPLTGEDDVHFTTDGYEQYHCSDLTQSGHHDASY